MSVRSFGGTGTGILWVIGGGGGTGCCNEAAGTGVGTGGMGNSGGTTGAACGAPIYSTTAGASTAGTALSGLGISETCPPHNGQKSFSQSITLLQRLHFFILKLPFEGVSLRLFKISLVQTVLLYTILTLFKSTVSVLSFTSSPRKNLRRIRQCV